MTSNPIVSTTYGPVQGIQKKSSLCDAYYSFQKIPYAKPPVGEFRFSDPQPPEKWTEPIDCTKQGPAFCAMNNIINKVVGVEDSLHMNVFTKNLTPVKPFPVMLWIHGGAFMRGSSGTEMYGPAFLLRKEIILISFNYRLGVFGFLSLEDESLGIPGNAGLKDQTMAMKWARENCASFGGDPENITLFGESAGGCSVHYHMISDFSKNLFNRAIVMSGVALNNWSIVPNNKFPERLATSLGWNGTGGQPSLLKFLKNIPSKELVLAQNDMMTPEEKKNRTLFPFGPVIEPYISEQCIIPEDPEIMCKKAWSNSLPIMIGGNSEEGLFSYPETIKDPTILENLDFEYLVPVELGLQKLGEKSKKLGAAMKDLYFGKSEPSLKTIDSYVDIMTDKLFWHGIHRTLVLRVNVDKAAPTFLYRFNFDSPTFNAYKLLMCGKGVKGVCHADDLSYLFHNILGNFAGEDELKTIDRMVEIWTKFALDGNPNCSALGELKWESLSVNKTPFQCLNISNELSMIDLPETKRMAFWDSLYE